MCISLLDKDTNCSLLLATWTLQNQDTRLPLALLEIFFSWKGMNEVNESRENSGENRGIFTSEKLFLFLFLIFFSEKSEGPLDSHGVLFPQAVNAFPFILRFFSFFFQSYCTYRYVFSLILSFFPPHC